MAIIALLTKKQIKHLKEKIPFNASILLQMPISALTKRGHAYIIVKSDQAKTWPAGPLALALLWVFANQVTVNAGTMWCTNLCWKVDKFLVVIKGYICMYISGICMQLSLCKDDPIYQQSKFYTIQYGLSDEMCLVTLRWCYIIVDQL